MSVGAELSGTVWDVVVAGGGNAGLCAAISAAEQGARTLLLEASPKESRGGNSRHTRNFRCMHSRPVSVLTESYGEDEYFKDLLSVTGGKTSESLARLVIRESEGCLEWMGARGVRFQPSLSGTLSLSRTNAFFLGGGKALVNAYYNRAEDIGVAVAYGARVRHVEIQGSRFELLEVEVGGRVHKIKARAAVLASGGFESNIDWLAQSWGEAARNFLVRGTPHNTGLVLKDMIGQGARTVGDASQCHAVAIDGRAPKFDGGIATRLDCLPFSVTVNRNGERFHDEGEDLWPKRYAIWGRLVAGQPGQVAFCVIDSKSLDLFMPSVFKPERANTLGELAKRLGLPPAPLLRTVEAFNRACQPGPFDSQRLDGLSTRGLSPPKTNWARPIDQPPFYGYSLRPGITFTYLGLKVDETARVAGPSGPYKNIWAAGEIMAGSILGQGYLAGFGMTIGTVFGRAAGREAARHAR